MKQDIHPDNYRPVLFEDTASGTRFIIGSTVKTEETAKGEDGTEYPYAQIEISSASHPFYTGRETTIDSAGRVERFKKRAEAAKKSASKSKKSAKK